MKLRDYQAYLHDPRANWPNSPMHIDVELTFEGHSKIKLCNCSEWMGGYQQEGNLANCAAEIRDALRKIKLNHEQVSIKKDTLDGSIDLIRDADGVLLFSIIPQEIHSDMTIPLYSSVQEG